jgi:hypothetical protein
MAKRTIRTINRSSRKVSKTSFKAIKKQAKATAVAEKAETKGVAAQAPTRALTAHNARMDERLRELVAWYMLQGMDEATARRRAQDEIDNDPGKD